MLVRYRGAKGDGKGGDGGKYMRVSRCRARTAGELRKDEGM